MAKFSFRKKVNVNKVITKIAVVVLALWVGSEILNSVAVAMNTSASAFQSGLTFLGFDTTTYANTSVTECVPGDYLTCFNGDITTTGILSIVGLIAGASIVLDFVKISM